MAIVHVNDSDLSKALAVRRKDVRGLLKAHAGTTYIKTDGRNYAVDIRVVPHLAQLLERQGVEAQGATVALCIHAIHLERALKECSKRKDQLIAELIDARKLTEAKQQSIDRLQEERARAEARTAEVAVDFGKDLASLASQAIGDRKQPDRRSSDHAADDGGSKNVGDGLRGVLFGINVAFPPWATPVILFAVAFGLGYALAYLQQEKLLGVQEQIQTQTAWVADLMGKTAEERKLALEQREADIQAQLDLLRESDEAERQAQQEIQQSRAEIARLGDDRNDLRQKVDALGDQVATYEKENMRLTEERDKLRSALDNFKGLVQGYREVYGNLEPAAPPPGTPEGAPAPAG